MIEIITSPCTLTDKQAKNEYWKVQKIFADQNLEVAKMSLWRKLNYDMPVKFSEQVQLIVKANKISLKTKIDYSLVKDSQTKKLIKLYLTDIRAFSQEWFKL